jgi:hypothetical protein
MLSEGAFEEFWRFARLAPQTTEEYASLTAALTIPTPSPAAWAARALGDFDRTFRWALRAADIEERVSALIARRARPVPSSNGLTLIEVEPGSWKSRLDPADELAKVFRSKHWLVFGGILVAFGAADWVVREIVIRPEVASHPTVVREAVRSEAPYVCDVHGDVTIQIEDRTFQVKCGPSDLWLPQRDVPQQRRGAEH